MSVNPLDNFGCMVFGNRTMQERLPKEVYKALRKTIQQGKSLDQGIAGVVANVMKDWAIEKGATHFSHWFQPMTGITAEKHESFLSLTGEGGIIMEFSGKELIQGESDASSFPSGGLRATFEARGYTAWDPTSYAFIKDGVLYIPTAFCSHTGDALDKKTPLMRSMEAINQQSLRVLRLLGDTEVKHVSATAGAEQEYFLIDKEMAEKRRDLNFCGRTLFGSKPPKGQELDDHYYSAINPRVQQFMKDLNQELWKLGVYAKTEHTECAPAQYELAPIFTTVNIATDHNQLTMELMKKIADRHGLRCLLHEKPFAGVNGSGKHNNWSLSTDDGRNLLSPGERPEENLIFIIFLTAVIAAVDDYQDLLRISVASAGNDHRLGGNEAPPAIISIFLGDEITALLDSIESGKPFNRNKIQQMMAGVNALPSFDKDNTDRNRTSPLAFTGNKFEFRMPGAPLSISGPNFVLNTIVADSLSLFADMLENSSDMSKEVHSILAALIKKHKRIIFNGNNYSKEWVVEAQSRGLLNLTGTAEALPHFIKEKNVSLFERYGILSKAEIHSRFEILIENYCKTLHIEALTMSDIVRRDITPAVIRYLDLICQSASRLQDVCPEATTSPQKEIIQSLSALLEKMTRNLAVLDDTLLCVTDIGDIEERSRYYRDRVLFSMQELREVVDKMECLVGKDFWPMPDYGDLLFGV